LAILYVIQPFARPFVGEGRICLRKPLVHREVAFESCLDVGVWRNYWARHVGVSFKVVHLGKVVAFVVRLQRFRQLDLTEVCARLLDAANSRVIVEFARYSGVKWFYEIATRVADLLGSLSLLNLVVDAGVRILPAPVSNRFCELTRFAWSLSFD
jgi:hypothetical protein